MIHTKDDCVAMQFESVILPDADGSYTTRLFAVEGRPGIWKRVTKATGGIDILNARFDGGTIYLVRCASIEAELAEAGFHLPQMGQERMEENKTAEVEAPAFKQNPARRLHA